MTTKKKVGFVWTMQVAGPSRVFVATLDEKSNVLHSEEGHTFKIDQNSYKLLREGTNQLEYKKVGE